MQFSNTKEDGLESIIVNWLVNQNDYEQGTNIDYNRDYAIDETRLFRFLQDTQPDALEKLGVFKTDIKKKQFLNRLQGEIAKRGVIDVLRNGVKVYPANLIMFYLTPTENNAKAKEMYEKNIFSVTRQLMYSNDSTRLALDMCIFINGLPVITFDVLKYYTPISSYYKLMKTVQDDPMFDKKRAQKKLRAFVESDSYTISQKAEMMVEHFHEQVISKGKVGGQARAMVVTSSIPRCVEYYYAINKCLSARHSPYKTIVAFSGEHKYQDQEPALTSAGLNGFPDAKIPKMLKTEPYRILIVADMFQTGFDEPLLHTMYVDKVLYDIKAVQTLSRLNRCHPQKHDTFVLDFANSPDMIENGQL